MKDAPMVKDYLAKLFLGSDAYVKWFSGIVFAMVQYFLPAPTSRTAALAAALFVGLDTLTGMLAAGVNGKPISSRAFSRVIVKLFGYGSFVAVVSISIQLLPFIPPIYAGLGTTGAIGFILATEAISILENITKMDVDVPSKPLLTALKKLRRILNGSEEPPKAEA